MNRKHTRHRTALSLLLVSVLLLSMFSLTGCSGGGRDSDRSNTNTGNYGEESFSPNEMGGGWNDGAGALDNSGQLSRTSIPGGDDVKLIRRASLTLEAVDFDQSANQLQQLVTDCGGYFESSNLDMGSYASRGYRYGNYTVRIPQDKYDSFLNSVGQLCHVTNRSESAEDVGLQYYNLESQIRLLEIKQERLLSLLEQAQTMEDIIQLENSLSEIQYLLEQNNSQRNRYDSLISYSTIDISLQQVERLSDGTPDQQPFGRQLSTAFRQGLLHTADSFSGLLLLIAYNIVPLVCFLAFVVILAIFLPKCRRRLGNKPCNPHPNSARHSRRPKVNQTRENAMNAEEDASAIDETHS